MKFLDRLRHKLSFSAFKMRVNQLFKRAGALKPGPADRIVSERDRLILEVVLDDIEKKLDDESEEARISSIEALSSENRTLATMSRVWGEVENGGLPQFFFNKPDARWHAWAIEAAGRMKMPETRIALEAGSEIVKELIPTEERGELEWDEYYQRVGDAFDRRCGSDFWNHELQQFESRGAKFIRSDPGLSKLAANLLAKRAENEKSRRDQKQPVTAGEKRCLFTASDLTPYLDDFTPKKRREKYARKRSANGTTSVEYNYADAAYGLSIVCEINLHSDEEDAIYWCETSPQLLWSALGWNFDPKRQVEERNEFFRWGDQSYYSVIIIDSEPFGFGFYARSGKKRFSLMLNGLLFRDVQTIAQALEPCLNHLESYEF